MDLENYNDQRMKNLLSEEKYLDKSASMTNKQLRMIVRIEKLLFEKKTSSFEDVVKKAKERTWP